MPDQCESQRTKLRYRDRSTVQREGRQCLMQSEIQ